ncbi:MAG: DUF2062 domain-containing protein [Polyangiaceae bacterium]
MRRSLTRLWTRTRELWERARREHSTPREVGWSVAVGFFSGAMPLVGFRMWIALGLASVLRLNRLWAFFGSRLCFSAVLVWIVFGEVELGHRLRAGSWADVAPADILAAGRGLLADWLLGVPLVAVPLSAAVGLVAYRVCRRTQAGVRRTPGEPRPPTSGSRPSTPPAPTS